jgi:hypothetical protein
MCMGGLLWWIINNVLTACKLGTHLVLSSDLINNLVWYLQPIQPEQSLYAVWQSCDCKQQCLYRRHTKFKGHCQISNQRRIQPPSYPHPKKIRLNEWGSPASLPTKLDAVKAGLVNQFVHNHNPSDIMKIYNVFCDDDRSYKNIEDISSARKVVKAKQSHTNVQDELEIVPTQTSWVPRLWNYLTTTEYRLYVSRIKFPQCFIWEMASNTVIIDSGASILISLHCANFIIYGPSNMKIKDLSSSNKVAGEGLIRWRFQDTSEDTVALDLPGYCIEGVDVHLLSPQVLLGTFGGHLIQTMQKIEVTLNNKTNLEAHFCARSCLPILPLQKTNSVINSFLTEAFIYPADSLLTSSSILCASNTNLSASQKELLMWHQRLSHASVYWIQILMQDQKWLMDKNDTNNTLHSGPFITPINLQTLTCDAKGLKCATCLCAKAHSKTTWKANPPDERKLKRNNLVPGAWVSIDHYISTTQERLPHTFGQEKTGYSCGALFVDHASEKYFTTVRTLQMPMRPSAVNDGLNRRWYKKE